MNEDDLKPADDATIVSAIADQIMLDPLEFLLDLPTSWQLTSPGDEFTRRMFAAINAMMLDMLAAVGRKDYDDRRRRQAQGIAKAKAAKRYRGRPEDTDRNAGIAGMLRSGMSWSAIQAAAECSRATIAKVAKREGVTQ